LVAAEVTLASTFVATASRDGPDCQGLELSIRGDAEFDVLLYPTGDSFRSNASPPIA